MAGTKYKNPPIEEAVCQFTLAQRAPWEPDTARHLFEKLRDRYPAMPTQQQILQANLTPAPGAETPGLSLAQNERVVFADTSGLSQLAIGPTAISIHRVKPYIGFDEDMLPRVERDIPASVELLKQSPAFSSVSVRYINKIEVTSGNFDLNEYFNYWGTADVLPASFDGTITGFFYRTVATERSRPVTLSLNLGSLVAPKDIAAFALDIELVYNFEEVADAATSIAQLVEIKTAENLIFESLITDKARELFK